MMIMMGMASRIDFSGKKTACLLRPEVLENGCTANAACAGFEKNQ